MPQHRIQTRSEEHGLNFFSSVREAHAHAQKHKDVWKISFEGPDGRRVRLVREGDKFFYEDLMDQVKAAL